MTNLNNINGIGIGLNTKLPQRETAAEVKENVVQDAPQVNSAANLIPQDEVLNVMAQQAAVNFAVNAPRTYDVAKYVTPEQAQRIAGFVTSFEDIIAQNLQAVNAEFGNNSLSDDDKMNIALSTADKMVS